MQTSAAVNTAHAAGTGRGAQGTVARKTAGYYAAALISAGFGIGFMAHAALHSIGEVARDAELAQYREHQARVREWEGWLEKNVPWVQVNKRLRVALPADVRRGRAELAADYFWPRPESEKQDPAERGP